MTNLFQKGLFVLHSGNVATWKIECDALTKDDWMGLAEIACNIYPDIAFSYAVGVPNGGVPFAEALNVHPWPRREASLPVLIVDDVLTTGSSIRELMREHPGSRGLVAFARGALPDRVEAVCTIPKPKLWQLLRE